MMSMQGLNASLAEPASPLTESDSVLMSYEVVLQGKGSDFQIGKVVTHLSLDDWADLHHVRVESTGNVRRAFAGEKTDLL